MDKSVNIYYVTTDRYSHFMPNVKPSTAHPGGGMGPKTLNAIETWKRYYTVDVGQDINAYQNVDVLVVEPLWFRLHGKFEYLDTPDLEEVVQQFENHPARAKVVYQSEFSLLKMPKHFRDRVVDAASVVTSNCEYQRQMYEMIGIESIRLCDPQSQDVFHHPNVPKQLSVVAMSRISTQKNSKKVVEVFKLLKDTPIQCVYVGGADLWGFARKQDKKLELEIREVADTFHHNLTQIPLGKTLATAGCAMFDVFHDCCASSNLQALMAGCYCFYGLHGLWAERPGVHDLDTPQDFVDAIAKATKDFTAPPAKKHRIAAEKWALNDSSCEQFLRDWEEVYQHATL